MNMTEAKNMINSDGVISTLEMINIIQTFRNGLQDVVEDLADIDSVGENSWHTERNIPVLQYAEWALDVFTKKLMFDLNED